MRRGVLAIIGTVAGTALLVGAKLGTPPPVDPNAAALDAPGGDVASAPAGSAAPLPAGSSAAAPAPAGTGRPSTPKPVPTPAAGGLKAGSFTGTGASARNYEVVKVTITVAGGRITVASGSCGAASGESKSICQGAMPKLQQETLTAQNAAIATVSGATATSSAYKTSLQSAINAARA